MTNMWKIYAGIHVPSNLKPIPPIYQLYPTDELIYGECLTTIDSPYLPFDNLIPYLSDLDHSIEHIMQNYHKDYSQGSSDEMPRIYIVYNP